ncbi:MAG TPA: MFS transporter [Nevskiaceae bacterium]|nr:MFS transporter [Nevskiaceae bacterium]
MSPRASRIADARLLGLLGLLYFAQGLPSGLLAKALPPLLREQGVSLSAIGLTGLLAAPWAMKFLWAPLVERTGTRRHWLLALNAITLALMAALAMRDFSAWVGDAFVALLILLFALNLVAATQDVVTDGLAVSRLTASLRGIGNSLQVIGYKIGMTLGSAVLLWLVAHWGWSLAYAALALLLVPVLCAAWLVAEPEPSREEAASHPGWRGIHGYLHLLRDFAARPGLGWWLATVATFKIGDSLGSRMIGPLLSDRGLTLAEIGALTGLASLVGLAGALLGGLVLLRLGHRNALLLFGSLQALGLAGYLPLADGPQAPWLVAAVVCFEQFADGLATVALFTLMMDACRASSPGVDYSVQASLLVIVTGVASLNSGLVADALGYGAVLGGGAVLTMLALLPVLRYFHITAIAPTRTAG